METIFLSNFNLCSVLLYKMYVLHTYLKNVWTQFLALSYKHENRISRICDMAQVIPRIQSDQVVRFSCHISFFEMQLGNRHGTLDVRHAFCKSCLNNGLHIPCMLDFLFLINELRAVDTISYGVQKINILKNCEAEE